MGADPSFKGMYINAGTMDDLSIPLCPTITSGDEDVRTSFVQLLHYLASTRASGRLTVTFGSSTATFLVREGHVIGMDVPGASLDKELVARISRETPLDPATVKKAMNKAKDRNHPLAMYLHKDLRVSHEALAKAIRSQRETVLGKLLGRGKGTMEFVGGTAGLGDPVAVGLPGLVWRWLRRFLAAQPLEELEASLTGHLFAFVRLEGLDKAGLLERFFTDDEQRALGELFDGTREVHTILATSGMPTKEDAARLVMLLLAYGVLTISRVPPMDTDPARIEALLTNWIATMKRGTYFERARVHWSAHHTAMHETIRTIREGYQRLHDDPNLPPSMREGAITILSLINEAVGAIDTAKKRQVYRSNILPEATLRLYAERLYKRAVISRWKGRWLDAARYADVASELSDDPKYAELSRQLQGYLEA